jgi:hypothetical protein
MSLRSAKTVDAYVDWVRQAVFEVDDPRACLQFELEDLKQFPAFPDPIEEGIKGRYQHTPDGTYGFRREDLPFMDLAAQVSGDIPFHTLLKQINETQRRGLEVHPED